jgi:hypothetical protein
MTLSIPRYPGDAVKRLAIYKNEMHGEICIKVYPRHGLCQSYAKVALYMPDLSAKTAPVAFIWCPATEAEKHFYRYREQAKKCGWEARP